MLSPERILFTLLLAALATLCGCADAYWIPGLSLPADAKVENRLITDSMPGGSLPPSQGSLKRVLSVAFSCSGDFDAAVSQLDSCLLGQGFTAQTPALANGIAVPPNTPCEPAFFGAMKAYFKPGSRYTVALLDVNGGLELTGLPAGELPGPRILMLYVVQIH